jgi:UDP-glucose-4-epimerase GalE
LRKNSVTGIDSVNLLPKLSELFPDIHAVLIFAVISPCPDSNITRRPGSEKPSNYNNFVSGKKRILVTGGAGYIGSNTTLQLLDAGYDVVVVDNLSRGHREAVDPARLRVVDLHDTDGLVRVMEEAPCEAVIHFAAYIAVGESMKIPEVYFQNNVAGSLSLLTAMVRTGIKRIVFSSTAAVYGMPERVPIPETEPYAAVNAYGESKVIVERLLHWFDQIHGIRGICLRYFNAAGADPDGRAGENHEPETHLIPLMFRAAQTGIPMTLFGDDYDTPDGTCVRDYVHVTDLARAHILAVEALSAGRESGRFNAGTGRGFSVKEVLRAVEEVTGKTVPHKIGPRREGDPPLLVADSGRLQTDLCWIPQYSDIRTIVETGWRWEAEKPRE